MDDRGRGADFPNGTPFFQCGHARSGIAAPVAEGAGFAPSCAPRVLRLTQPAPDIAWTILDGGQGKTGAIGPLDCRLSGSAAFVRHDPMIAVPGDRPDPKRRHRRQDAREERPWPSLRG